MIITITILGYILLGLGASAVVIFFGREIRNPVVRRILLFGVIGLLVAGAYLASLVYIILLILGGGIVTLFFGKEIRNRVVRWILLFGAMALLVGGVYLA